MKPPEELRLAHVKLTNGDLVGAKIFALAALRAAPTNYAVHLFLGVVNCKLGNILEGVQSFRRAKSYNESDLAIRLNLANALIQLGSLHEALDECVAAEPIGRLRGEYWFLTANVKSSMGDLEGAEKAYERAVTRAPGMFQAWNNFGNLLRKQGKLEEAISALRTAAHLQPVNGEVHLNLGRAFKDANTLPDAIEALTRAVSLMPQSPEPLLDLASIYTMLGDVVTGASYLNRSQQFSPNTVVYLATRASLQIKDRNYLGAEVTLDELIRADPSYTRAYVDLINTLEQSNKLDRAQEAVTMARAAGIPHASYSIAEARLLKREGRFDEALECALIAEVAGSQMNMLKAQELGELYDRLGRPAQAMQAFGEMNRFAATDPGAQATNLSAFSDRLAKKIQLTNSEWFSNWKNVPDSSHQNSTPVFLLGFPRSGTTLLDTVLLGHPDVCVLEELPFLEFIESSLGDYLGLPELSGSKINELRTEYHRLIAEQDAAKRPTVIDKHPLHSTRLAAIYKLFPNAKIIVALRHPCDVILSCYMQNFEPNPAMVNFYDLGSSARLYNNVMIYLTNCLRLMPLDSHFVRYEDFVVDTRGELQKVFSFLGLPWYEAALDHQKTVISRGNIGTPSYRQVTEKVYTRSVDRWRRYEEYIMPYRELLNPWVTYFGYPSM